MTVAFREGGRRRREDMGVGIERSCNGRREILESGEINV